MGREKRLVVGAKPPSEAKGRRSRPVWPVVALLIGSIGAGVWALTYRGRRRSSPGRGSAEGDTRGTIWALALLWAGARRHKETN
jgi:hypothetical protein